MAEVTISDLLNTMIDMSRVMEEMVNVILDMNRRITELERRMGDGDSGEV